MIVGVPIFKHLRVVLLHFPVFIDYTCKEERLLSDSADAQADLSLPCSHTPKCILFHVIPILFTGF